MIEYQSIVDSLEFNYLDADRALDGVEPSHLHVRINPQTLSISEQVAHIAYCEALGVFGFLDERSQDEWPVESRLLQPTFWYPPEMLNSPIHNDLVTMDLSAIKSEWQNVHRSVVARLRELEQTVDAPMPKAWAPDKTVGGHLRYLSYHVAYHVGQIYLMRHLLGETTPEQA